MANRAVGTPGNIAGQAFLGFGVGDPSFLGSEESKVAAYYRNLEYGTDIFLGHKLVGLFGPGSRLLPSGSFSPIGEGFGQQFFPLGPSTGNAVLASGATAEAYLRHNHPQTIRSGKSTGGIHGIIKRPIVAQNAYSRAARDFDPGAREVAAVKQILGELGIGRPQSGSRTNMSVPTKVFLKRTALMGGRATSARTGRLGDIDQRFRAQITEANRRLALALAVEVAALQKKDILRPNTSTGRLVEATLDKRNRFPN